VGITESSARAEVHCFCFALAAVMGGEVEVHT
jgi:hypothetical protein